MALITGPINVRARRLDAARAWYEEKLGCRLVRMDNDDVGPVALLQFPGDPEPSICLSEVPADEATSDPHGPVPVLFAGDVEKAHRQLTARGVRVGPLQVDRTGLQFFEFRDSENNVIEVCQNS